MPYLPGTRMFFERRAAPTPPSNWDVFDFSGLESMTPVVAGKTLPSPAPNYPGDFSRMNVCGLSSDRIVVCDVTGPNVVCVYSFDEGHGFELEHLVTTPVYYKQHLDSGFYSGFVVFDPTGLVAYVYPYSGNSGERRFVLTSPYDLSTASATHVNINYLGGYPAFAGFSSDGMSSYVKTIDGPEVKQRVLVNPYDVVTKPYAAVKTVNLNTLTGQTNMTWKGFCFSPDGRYAVCTTGNGLGKAWKFGLGTPWDVETMEYLGMGVIQSSGMMPNTVVVNPEGTRMLVSNYGSYASNFGLYEYDLTNL